MFYNDYEHFINKIVWFIKKKKHRDNFRNILYDIVNSMYKLEYMVDRLNVKNDDDSLVIIQSTGGLADQFWKYVLGESIKRNYNVNVKYDITWFRTHHKDIDGNHERPFQLLKLCPDINYDIASENDVFFYKACFGNMVKTYYRYDINNILQTKRNIYLDCYPELLDIDIDEIFNSIDLDKYHYSTLKDNNLLLYNELSNNNEEEVSVVIHARLGDSHTFGEFKTIFNSSYNNYADYFLQSIDNLFNKLKPLKTKFFFFSDDIEWLKNNVISKLNNNISYKINYENNEPYLYMYLMSKAKHYIISLGGFGNLATLFNRNKDKIVIRPNDFKLSKT